MKQKCGAVQKYDENCASELYQFTWTITKLQLIQ